MYTLLEKNFSCQKLNTSKSLPWLYFTTDNHSEKSHFLDLLNICVLVIYLQICLWNCLILWHKTNCHKIRQKIRLFACIISQCHNFFDYHLFKIFISYFIFSQPTSRLVYTLVGYGSGPSYFTLDNATGEVRPTSGLRNDTAQQYVVGVLSDTWNDTSLSCQESRFHRFLTLYKKIYFHDRGNNLGGR
jgi:hypothetical protein